MKQNQFLIIATLVGIVAIGTIALSFTAIQDNSNQKLEDKIAKEPFEVYSQNNQAIRKAPPLPLDAYGEKVSSLNVAKDLSGVPVKELSYVPLDLEVSQIRVQSDDINMVTQFFVSKNTPIKNISTFDDVMDSHGIVIIQTKQDVDSDHDIWLDDYMKSRTGMEIININGVKGLAGSGDPSKGTRSEVIFQDGELQIDLVSVTYPKEILINMAQNMR